MKPSPSELAELRSLHGSVDSVARALGLPRSQVREWYADSRAPHLRLVDDNLSEHVDDVEIPVIVRDYSHLDALRVYPLGDVHKGAATHQRERWREWLGYLEQNAATSMIGTGDFHNAAIIGSKSDVYDERMTVGDAKRELRGELRKLADEKRIDVLVQGNHDQRVEKAVGDCPVQDIADWLDVPYARSACLLVYRVGDIEYEVFVRHGTGNGQALSSLAKSGQIIQADVHISGHVHRQAVSTDEFLVRVGNTLIRRRRIFVVSGSFLGLERYAVERGYVPTRIGAPRIHLDGRRHDVHVSL